ncbi:hypothetical protein BLNAU_20985 [Blattamonas nauphoetae]|uniref:OTU domain-containing protein n=1 Tax=Blattamonas nauphoetae TaxID=2049346 RepID=A0ABQ9WX67_9EUKA|nr:hypothetical protein BLNAU_20985 [Blattamonas nauphoetae]
MPLITLTMSLGVNEVKIARHGEPSFIFRNRNKITNKTAPIPCDYDEQSLQDKKLDPIGKAFITINRRNEPPIHIERDTFCYTYDVFMCQPTSNKQKYNPKEVYSSPDCIGRLTVPSIHHFPHFFKLFVNKNNQVENRLRGTTWHVVDDFILSCMEVPRGEHVVLLTSPNKKRWENITEHKETSAPTMMFNVPKFLFPEMIHMFNAIPCPYNFMEDTALKMMISQQSIQKQGMIPRHLFDPLTFKTGKSVHKSSPKKKIQLNRDHYGAKTPHRYIHSSSPQFDPMNWFTQHATKQSFRIVQNRTTKKMNKSMELNLFSRVNKQMSTIIYAGTHEETYLRAVETGLKLTAFRLIHQKQSPKLPISFPKTKYSLYQIMRSSSVIKAVTIPDPTTLNKHEARAYDTQWDFLFKHCLHKEALEDISPPIKGFEEKVSAVASGIGKLQPNSDQMEVITSHLVPSGETNAGFDSILLMFRCKKVPFHLHSLAVVFLQGTTGKQHGITDEGVRLMKKWCYILATQYSLKRVQIFPSFIVPKDALKFHKFQLNNQDNLKNFIPEQNIWIAQFETKGEIHVGNIRIPPMTASTAPILARFIELEVNYDPQIVRCTFCGTLITDNFPNHCCAEMKSRIPTIDLNNSLIDDLERVNKPGIQSTEKHIEIVQHVKPSEEKDQEQDHSQELKEDIPKKGKKADQSQTHKTEDIPKKGKKEDQFPEPIKEDINIGFVSDPSVLQHKQVNRGIQPTIRPPPHREVYVQIAYTNGIPGTPDFYRLPVPPQPSTIGTNTTQNQPQPKHALDDPNDDNSDDISTQPLSEYLNDQSEIIEAHDLWCGRFKLSYVQDGTYQYRPITLGEQPFQSLEFDLPSVDITDPTLNTQFMLPYGANAIIDPLNFYPKQVADHLRSKRIEEESLWEWLNCMNPHPRISGALQTDEAEMTEGTTTVTERTHNTRFMLPAGANARIDPLDVGSEAVTDYLHSKRVEYEYFWQWLNRKNPPTRMGDALQADENELIERIQNCGNEIEKSRLTCLLAKGLLLRSRLSLQSGDLNAAVSFLVWSKQNMELNDTAEVECELMQALGRDTTTNSHGFDELERVLVTSRNCFDATSKQWNQEEHNLPILLSPSFHTLQFYFKQVQDCVTKLRWYLNIFGGAHIIARQQMNVSRSTQARNAILQALREGLTLQFQIAWKAGDESDVNYLLRELAYINRIEGNMDSPPEPPTQFKSQKKQMKELAIRSMKSAIQNIISTHEKWKMINDNASVSGTPPIQTSVQSDIHMNAQLQFDRISTIINMCSHKLVNTSNTKIVKALDGIKTELRPLVTTTSHRDADERTDQTDSRSYDALSNADTRIQTFQASSTLPSSRVNFPNREGSSPHKYSYFPQTSEDSDDTLFFKSRLGDANVVNPHGDGNCWLYAVYDQLTPSDLDQLNLLARDYPRHCDEAVNFFVSLVRPQLVTRMMSNRKELEEVFQPSDKFPSVDKYIKSQLKDYQWGGGFEFRFLSTVIGKRIAVHYPNTMPTLVFPEESDLPIINIGFINENHFVSLHNVPEVQKSTPKKSQEAQKPVEEMLAQQKPTVVKALKRDQPTEPKKQSTTTGTGHVQKGGPKRSKKKKDQSNESSIPLMPSENFIP